MSVVLPAGERETLLDHVQRIRNLERGGSMWIYVGTVGVDGVDALLTPQSPAFENSWTNALGPDAPVSFTMFGGWVHLRGGFFGGVDGTTIFTLPAGYRPTYVQPMVIPTHDVGHFATVVVNADGTVVFGTTV